MVVTLVSNLLSPSHLQLTLFSDTLRSSVSTGDERVFATGVSRSVLDSEQGVTIGSCER